MSKIKVAGFVNDSITDGPGIRFVVFTQGCPRRCKGCHNPQTWDFEGGTETDHKEILQKIKQNPLLDGVTFSGGDPMSQAEALVPLAKEIKEIGLNLAVYTGYLFEELDKVNGANELLKYVDVLIDGPFIMEQRDYTLKFKGSKNQRVIDVQNSLKAKKIILNNEEKWN